LGSLYIAGGLFALASVVLPHGRPFDLPAALIAAGASSWVGLAVWLARPLTERWAHALVAFAGVLVLAGVYSGGGTAVSMSSDVFLVWVALAAALFLPPKAAAVQVAALCVGFAVVMALVGGSAAPAQTLFVVGTAGVAAAVTAYDRAQLTRLAKIDFLTGLPNREELARFLDRELARAARTGLPLAVAMLDLDNFKEINDRSGHQAGDRALVELTGLWVSGIRPTDLLARLGGDEFVVVMPATTFEQGRAVLARLECKESPCGWSAGLVVWRPGEDAHDLLGRADVALYRAKADRGKRAPESPWARPADLGAGPPDLDAGPAGLDAGPAGLDAGSAGLDAGPTALDAGPAAELGNRPADRSCE